MSLENFCSLLDYSTTLYRTTNDYASIYKYPRYSNIFKNIYNEFDIRAFAVILRTPFSHFYETKYIPEDRLLCYEEFDTYANYEFDIPMDMIYFSDDFISLSNNDTKSEIKNQIDEFVLQHYYDWNMSNKHMRKFLKLFDFMVFADTLDYFSEEANPYLYNFYDLFYDPVYTKDYNLLAEFSPKYYNLLKERYYNDLSHHQIKTSVENDEIEDNAFAAATALNIDKNIVFGEKQSGFEEDYILEDSKPVFKRDKIKNFSTTAHFDNIRKHLNTVGKTTEKDTYVNYIRNERKQKREQQKIIEENRPGPEMKQCANAPESKTFINMRKQKEHNRQGYLMRRCKPGTPFYLDPKNGFFKSKDGYNEIDIIERLRLYNKTHLCKCKRRYNKIWYEESEHCYKVDCDHTSLNIKNQPREIIRPTLSNYKCINCGKKGMHTISRRNCDCDIIWHCPECKITTYEYQDAKSIICLCKKEDNYKDLNFEPQFVEHHKVDSKVKSYAQAVQTIFEAKPAMEKKFKLKTSKKKFFESLKPMLSEDKKQQSEEEDISCIFGDKQSLTDIYTAMKAGVSSAFEAGRSFVVDTIKKMFTNILDAITDIALKRMFTRMKQALIQLFTTSSYWIVILNQFVALSTTNSFIYGISCLFGIIASCVHLKHYVETTKLKNPSISPIQILAEHVKARDKIKEEQKKKEILTHRLESQFAEAQLTLKLLQLEPKSKVLVTTTDAYDYLFESTKNDKENSDFYKLLSQCDKHFYANLLFLERFLLKSEMKIFAENKNKPLIKEIFNGALEKIVDSMDELEEFTTAVEKFKHLVTLHFHVLIPDPDPCFLLDLFANRMTVEENDEYEADEDEKGNPFGSKESFGFGDIITMTAKIFSLPLSVMRKFYLMNLLRNFNTVFTTARNVTTMFKEWIHFLPDFLTQYFKPNLGKEWLLMELKKEDSLPSRLAQAALKVKLAIDISADKEEIIELRKEAKDLLVEFEKYVIDEGVMVDINVTRWLKIMSEMINTVNMGIQREREPFCIRIIGPPGCAKSTYWASMVSPLFKGRKIEEIVKDLTYVRNPGIEFWDGLSVDNHRIVLYDDFAQQTEETEFPEIISLVSRAAFIPPMASVDYSKPELGYKGQQYSPDLVVLLSNVDCISGSKTINFCEAIERRPHLNIVFPSHAKPGHDLEKMAFEVFKSAGTKMDRKKEVVHGISSIHDVVLAAYQKYLTTSQIIQHSVEKYAYKGNNGMDISQGTQRSDYQEQVLKSMFGEKQDKNTSLGMRMLNYILYDVKTDHSLIRMMKEKDVYTIREFIIDVKPRKRLWYEHIGKLALFGGGIAMVLIGIYIYNRTTFEGILGEDQSGTTVTKSPNTMKVITGSRQNYTPEFMINNQCSIVVNGKRVHGLFIKGRTLLTVRHIFCDDSGETTKMSSDIIWKLDNQKINFINDNTEFVIEMANGQTINQKFKSSELVELYKDGDDMSDVVLYQCDSQISAKRNIMNHFIPFDHVLKGKSINFNGIDREQHRLIRTTTVDGDDFIMIYNVGKSAWAVAKSFRYCLPTMKGDCGSYISTNEIQPKIVGIHIAGYKTSNGVTYGVSTRVSRDLLEKGLEAFGVHLEQEDYHHCVGESQMFVEPQNLHGRYGPSIAPLGILNGCRSYPVGKTEIIRSPLYDEIQEHTTIPAIINIHDKRLGDRDLLLEGVNKYGKVKKLHPEKVNDLVFESMFDDIDVPTDVEPEILTTLEAINGKGDIKGLDMSTSPGFPFSCLGKGGEKRKLFVFEDEMWKPNEELDQLIVHYENMFKEGIVPFLPWVDCLKDERRPIQKVLEGKTRLFSSASVIYTIIFKKYYGSYIEHRVKLKNKTFSRIGINKDSIEWDEHIRELANVGMDHAIDIDYTAMDGNNAIDNVELFFRLADAWYKDSENQVIRRTIREFETHGKHIAFNKELRAWVVYELIGGTNSGSLITALLNTDSNEANIRRAWLYLAPREYRGLYYYHRFVRTASFGDDIVISVHTSIVDWFHGEAIADVLLEYGVILTNGSKGNTFTFQKVTDCVFLKNTTGTMMNRYVPLMKHDAMLEPLNWIRKSEFMISEDQACEDNCNAVLRNCFWYGKKVFNHYRQEILNKKPHYNLLHFDPLFEDYFEFNILSDPLSLGGKRTKNL